MQQNGLAALVTDFRRYSAEREQEIRLAGGFPDDDRCGWCNRPMPHTATGRAWCSPGCQDEAASMGAA